MDLVDSNHESVANESDPLSLDDGTAIGGPNPQTAQEIIVHVSLPQVQSVIQPTSVIQSAPSLQAAGLPKGNIILVSKPNSVIHAPSGGTLQTLQVIDARETGGLLEDENTKKRREILARRPSYRKILNELGGGEISEDKGDSPIGIDSDDSNSPAPPANQRTLTLGGTHYQTTAGLLKVIPAGTIQLATGATNQSLGDPQSLPTLTMTNAAGGSTIVQYAQGQEGQFFVPVCVAGDLQTYTLRSVTSTAGLGAGVVVGTTGTSHTLTNAHTISEDPSKKRDARLVKSSNSGSGGHSDEWDTAEPALQKREMRLLKNREAARECRRKKKEYIKCLENRVAVLENQNKALIEELKSLKELYCNQKVD